MLSEQQLSAAIGSTAYGVDGDKIGTVEHFFVDDRTGQPTWVAVTTGLFGMRHSVVPAVDATFADGALQVPVTKEAVKSVPEVGGSHLDPSEEATLRRHYGLESAGTDDAGRADGDAGGGTGYAGVGDVPAAPAPQRAGADQGTQPVVVAAPTQDAGSYQGAQPVPDAAPTQELRTVSGDRTPPVPASSPAPPQPAQDGAMTRSEEQLRVSTERVATTRTRLVKYVVTEEVQITVPVRREEIRIEEVPLDGPDPVQDESLSGPDAVPGAGGQQGAGYGTAGTGGLPDEIILHTERPVVTMEVVPTERVRLSTELVHGQEQVSAQVQREQIVVDQEGPGRHAAP